jgi:asparagine synthase (glutamine-hydrolysing)
MCGIAGIFSLNGTPIQRSTIKAMCDAIAHRGPDDHRYLFGGVYGYDYHRHEIDPAEDRRATVGLGHRRLSIVDIKHGHQPMANEDRNVWVIYNGEIFNHQDLRPSLIARGHHFETNADTEVILHLYEEKGVDCALDLNGQFAFGIWDARDNSFLLVRDRFGIKPLYYTICEGRLLFGSEIKAILQDPRVPRKLNYQALSEHFTFQNTYGDKTFFDGIHLLPAGHWLRVHPDGRIEQQQYWDLEYRGDDLRNEATLQNELREHLETAVKRQLMSEVPVGAHLSGGMDSGSIAALATRNIPHLQTFNCGFDIPENADQYEQYFDESSYARLIASQLDVQHHELRINHQDNFPVMAHVAWHLDEPRVGISYQNYHLAQFIHGNVTVVLGGAGGDEFFGGYDWRYKAIADCPNLDAFKPRYYQQWTRFLTDEQKHDWFFSAESNRALAGFSTYDSFLHEAKNITGRDPLSWALYFDTKTFLHGLLVVGDKLGMSASLEERVPLLDHDLVDFALRLPSEWKLRGGQGKYMLRNVMREFVPEEIAKARKQGFTPPDATWYRSVLKPDVTGLLLDERTLSRGIFQPAGIQRILDEHFSQATNHRFLIWSLMIFEWWNRLFIDGDPLPEITYPKVNAVSGSGLKPTV